MTKIQILSLLLGQLLLLLIVPGRRNLSHANIAGGKWTLIKPSIGIVAMHMQLLPNDKVLIYDRTDFGKSNLSLPNHQCRYDTKDVELTKDCTSHSVEYDVSMNTVRPLMILTDIWCSSGAMMPDGTVIQTGGFNDGDHVVRVYKPCNDGTCDWQELDNALTQRRWYSTNHLLPDGRQIIIGGRKQFNYEFYPKTYGADQVYDFPFLNETNDPHEENNLYPFVFLNMDGNLFIFVNNRSILFDYSKNIVVKTYPIIPGGEPRNYPSTGSAVLLPLKLNMQGLAVEAEVLICGGAPRGAFIAASKGNFLGALKTCGRIKINDPKPKWVMETMPRARVMGDMILLPNGMVLIINGAFMGSAGYGYARRPVLNPVIYRPNSSKGLRFQVQNPSTIPRVYHSTAILLRDGRVLVGGSNTQNYYNFSGILFPTELSMETFLPSYLDQSFAYLRPIIISPVSQSTIAYGLQITIRFSVEGKINGNLVRVTLVAPSFNTHSFSMHQRLLILGAGTVKSVGNSTYEISVMTPSSGNLAPSGYYLLFVVHQEIPSVGIWVKLQ